MSVINQVLNQLEQRGVQANKTEQTMVRAVAHPRRDFILPLMMIGLALIVGIAVWQWLLSREPVITAVDAVVMKEHTDMAPVAPELSVPAENTSTELFVPASGLDIELNLLPPSSSVRQDPEQELSSHNNSQTPSRVAVAPVVTVQPSLPEIVAVQAASSVAPIKKVSSSQLADAEFRRAAGLMQLGRIDDAIAGYETALHLDADHDAARQALVALLLEGERNADAEKVLLDGLSNKPEHIGFIILLARLQVERGALGQATVTLQESLPFAETQADYRAFLAALLQRQNRNEEAIQHYQIALQYVPDSGIWLMGYGISLLAMQRNVEAKDVFQRALNTRTLAPELQRFVQQKLKGL